MSPDDGTPAVRLRVGTATDVGRHRTSNEDAFLSDDARRLYAVADGMGGHRAGEVASSTALESLDVTVGDGTDLAAAIEEANAAVWRKALDNPEMRGMGTTLTAVRIDGATALVGHVGDSRAYLMRDGALTRVTDDHSLVEQLVREGRLTPEEAATHPQRSVITRALGVDDAVEVDTYSIDLHTADRLLLCSDGLTSMISDEAISRLLRRARDPQQAAQALVDAANQAGGDDNITVVVVDVLDAGDDEAALAASRALAGEPVPDEATGQWEHLADAPTAEAPLSRAERRKGRKRRSSVATLRRIAVYTMPVLVVLGIAAGVTGRYARGGYFLDADAHGRVVLMKGRPGGFLIWGETLEEKTTLRVAELDQLHRADVADHKDFSSLASARGYLGRVERDLTPTTTTAPAVAVPATPNAPATTLAP